jgi:WD40 repeat protein
MSYCINPNCPRPNDPGNANNRVCRHCGSDLLILGRYQVMRLLSEKSGFGKIYEAFEGPIPKIVKILREDHNKNPKVVELFQQEANVLGHLDHPGIPKVEPDGYFQFFPRGAKQPLHGIVMEKIEGPNLRQWMQQQGNHPIGEQQALDWLKQLVEILHLVHQKNYFHRDIKPENIMVRPSGQLVLIDFGTAREMTYTYLAAVGGTCGVTKVSSAGYTPPEQEKGHAVPQSDFYALGRTIVYLLTGKELTDRAIYDSLNDEVLWRDYAQQISPQFANFIDKLIAHKAANRPKNTQEILDSLAVLSQNAIAPKPGYPSMMPSARSLSQIAAASTQILPSDRSWLIGGVLALLVGWGGYSVWRYYRAVPQIAIAETLSPTKTFIGHSSFINCLVFSPDGQLLASGSADKTIKIWEVATGSVIRTLKGHTGFVNFLAISPDGQLLVSASADRTIKVWNLATGQAIRTLKGHAGFVNFLAISPDGQLLVSASADQTIKVWNLATGQAIHTLKGHKNSVNSLAISPDGQTLFSAGADATIKVWNLSTRKEIRTLKGHQSFVNYLAISSDGKLLFSASADKTIKIWQIANGQEIDTLKGHTSFVNYLELTPDGQKLISSSPDNQIKIWNLATGKEIRTLKGNFNYMNNLAVSPITISPDGETFATGNTDKKIKIWQIP